MLHILDIVGSVFSFFSTMFYVFALELCWPVGVIATVINGTLYGIAGIYGDMCLEVIYFFFMFYGWYQWRYGGKNHSRLSISHLKLIPLMQLSTIALLGMAATFAVLTVFTDSTVPALDSITTVLSLCAQWLMCVKIIETWVVWFVVDGIYVYLYFDKLLPVHSALLLIYLGMALIGLWRWHHLMHNKKVRIS